MPSAKSPGRRTPQSRTKTRGNPSASGPKRAPRSSGTRHGGTSSPAAADKPAPGAVANDAQRIIAKYAPNLAPKDNPSHFLDTPVTAIKGVGPRVAKLLARLRIERVGDLLRHFPARYDRLGPVIAIKDVRAGEHAGVCGKVVSSGVTGSPRMPIIEIMVNDGSGFIKAKWFNQRFLKGKFRVGQRIVLRGAVKPPWRGTVPEIDNPEYELLAQGQSVEEASRDHIVPVHPATEGLSAKHIRSIIRAALDRYLVAIEDPMPGEILRRHALPALSDSLGRAHFPPDDEDVDALNRWATPYQRRLAFEELFMLEAGIAVMKRSEEVVKGRVFAPKGELLRKLRAALPWPLTRAQERVVAEITVDMARNVPMHRLVQGDVGSGKTVVALAAMLTAIECGAQGALMAPTEILAEQHYINIHKLVEAIGLKPVLLTSATRGKALYDTISTGGAHIIVGTHALIQESVQFHDLGLAVIDEQHRFGVAQRAELRRKSQHPDVLIMTATPIPRTLAMTLYGDLDFSVIDELPPGRTPVETELFMPDRKQEIYKAIEDEVASGGQAYVVYPMIEESEEVDLKSAVTGLEGMKRKFPSMRVGLLHGRMKPQEKEAVMSGFKAGGIDILVCTTVVEVGVDVPNASLMLIVHAERFGLSQLHQLRGRVGRGRRKSRCLLLAYSPVGEESSRRLAAMCATGDGFRIAEEDLAIRGPGDFFGSRQHGLPELRVADLVRDTLLLKAARDEAFALIALDPELAGYPGLRAALSGFWHGRVELFGTG